MNKIKNIFTFLIPILISIVSCTNSSDKTKTAEDIIQGNWLCKKVELNNGYVDTIFNSSEDFLTLSKK